MMIQKLVVMEQIATANQVLGVHQIFKGLFSLYKH